MASVVENIICLTSTANYIADIISNILFRTCFCDFVTK